MPGSKGAAWLLDVRLENAPAGAVMIPIRLERREPARNRLRFYTIAVTRTLFDGWAVVREWGRIGQPGTVGGVVRDRKRRYRGGRCVSRRKGAGYRAVGGRSRGSAVSSTLNGAVPRGYLGQTVAKGLVFS